MALIALLPALLLLTWLCTKDRLHPEPRRAVFGVFLRGAAIVLPAGIIERMMLQGEASPALASWQALFVTAFFIAGMVEEFLKAAIVERAAIQRGRVRAPVDCIVYAGACALGFAAVENILYVTGEGWPTALLRAVTAVPAHLMFGILMGTAFARSIWYGRSRGWAYVVPAAAHGLYDSFALSNSWVGDVLLYLYLILLMEVCLRNIDWATRKRVRQAST
ncbi:PrsW family glutamic-type intramembrane protease [Alicyclobacillus sp.]|uniref:PrsW family intramembrane metalloprotease n=1 Tax=Alicyclobacillus sp. TaxID=61169 RepID=UPI0025C1741A|nr:PrsW family glutamic-type intramembrane protease [Alicyclobacillus sp.]